MKRSTRSITHAAVLAALYVVLTYMQNFLLPGTTSMAIQFRVSEALCIFAFFTPAAIPGLTIGCLLFNLSYANALPLDFLVGSLATLLATAAMWYTRKLTVKKLPLLGLFMPALFNAIFVGWELTVYIGDSFWINALYVALGELGVLYVVGTLLYIAIRSRKLDETVFA